GATREYAFRRGRRELPGAGDDFRDSVGIDAPEIGAVVWNDEVSPAVERDRAWECDRNVQGRSLPRRPRPARQTVACEGLEDAIVPDAQDSIVVRIGKIKLPGRVDGHAKRQRERRRSRWTILTAVGPDTSGGSDEAGRPILQPS